MSVLVKKYVPDISIEQLVAYEPGRPETYSPYGFLNSVMEALVVLHPNNTKEAVVKYLDIDERKFSIAIEVLTGLKFLQLRDEYLKHLIKQLEEKHPKWTVAQIAKAIGYQDASAVWRLMHRDVRKKKYAERKRKGIYDRYC